jgi:AcrR family transcriptional regulator
MSERKEEILEAGLEIFSEKGYFNSKVAEIVEEVGIAKGTFYLYFDSKKDLFLEMINRYELLMKENINLDVLKKDELTLEAKLSQLTKSYFDFYLDNEKLTNIIKREAVSIDDDFFEELQKMKRASDQIFREIYESLLANNEIGTENNYEIFVNLFSGVINSYIMRNSIILEKEIDFEKSSQEIGSYLARALK